jgi:DNA-binding response OmpR family regulator
VNKTAGPILIVDDDRGIADFIEMALEDEGYASVRAADGEEATRRVAEDNPALVLLDITMPLMDGRAFYRWLRSTGHRQIPVVLMTAAGNASHLYRDLGANDYLVKPFELEHLLACVDRWVSCKAPTG